MAILINHLMVIIGEDYLSTTLLLSTRRPLVSTDSVPNCQEGTTTGEGMALEAREH